MTAPVSTREHPAAAAPNSSFAVTTTASSFVATSPSLANPATPVDATGRVANGTLSSISAVGMPITPNLSGASGPSESSPAPASHAPAVSETTSQPVVQSVRLIEAMGQSEMRIGLRTQAFGSVEVHTALRETQLGLAVSSEKGDLRGFLQPDVPAIQSLLQQHDLRLENIRFVQSGIDLGAGSSGNSDSPPHAFPRPGGSLPATLVANGEEEPAESVEPGNRLSVHA